MVYLKPIEVGTVFGRLTVVGAPRKGYFHLGYYCRCSCGKDHRVVSGNLRNGSATSCGCYASERKSQRSTTHGQARPGRITREFFAWVSMRRRCYDENEIGFPDYGGRGITVCDRWRDNFENFFADMGRKPTPGHSLERIDNNGDYEPTNCRWATKKEQMRNTRRTRWVTYIGREMSLAEAAEIAGANYKRAHGRMQKGWSLEAALGPPTYQSQTRIDHGIV